MSCEPETASTPAPRWQQHNAFHVSGVQALPLAVSDSAGSDVTQEKSGFESTGGGVGVSSFPQAEDSGLNQAANPARICVWQEAEQGQPSTAHREDKNIHPDPDSEVA